MTLRLRFSCPAFAISAGKLGIAGLSLSGRHPPVQSLSYPVFTFSTPTRTLLLLVAASTAAVSAQTPASSPSAFPVANAIAPKAQAAKPAPRRAKAKPKAYQPPYNPNVVVLDPAHGGQDSGANLGPRSGSQLEKDFNLAFANRLNTLLTAKGFSVVLTHTDANSDTSADQRVELANRSRAVACLLLHASPAGRGIHLFTSSLTAPALAEEHDNTAIIPWDSAQAASLPRSLQLANELSTAFNSLKVPLILGRASVSPIDSMSCPAVLLEIAPAAADSSVSDDAYQQHIAESVVAALTFWRQHAQDQIAAESAAQNALTNGAQAPAGNPAAPAPKPRPRPKPAVIAPPEELPLAPDNTPVRPLSAQPAPIVRRPPPPAAANPASANPSPAATPPGAQP